MSLISIKRRIMNKPVHEEKDLSETRHSQQTMSSFQNSIKNWSPIKILFQSRLKVNHSQQKQKFCRSQSQSNKQNIHANQNISSPTYFSPQIQKNKQISAQKTSPSEPVTPKKLKVSYEKPLNIFKRKIIGNLSEIKTVESKHLFQSTPKIYFQESQIIQRQTISMSTLNINPIKLIYEKEDYQKHINQKSEIQIIRQTSSTSKLIMYKNIIYGLIQIYNGFCMESVSQQGTMQLYHKIKNNNHNYYVCEPFYYSLYELFQKKQINKKQVEEICQFLKVPIEQLCRFGYSSFEIDKIQHSIFYTNGTFKIAPIFKKGKQLKYKSEAQVLQQIKQYLINLIIQ